MMRSLEWIESIIRITYLRGHRKDPFLTIHPVVRISISDIAYGLRTCSVYKSIKFCDQLSVVTEQGGVRSNRVTKSPWVD